MVRLSESSMVVGAVSDGAPASRVVPTMAVEVGLFPPTGESARVGLASWIDRGSVVGNGG
jgi:hypothetical protein